MREAFTRRREDAGLGEQHQVAAGKIDVLRPACRSAGGVPRIAQCVGA